MCLPIESLQQTDKLQTDPATGFIFHLKGYQSFQSADRPTDRLTALPTEALNRSIKRDIDNFENYPRLV